ncbi:MAG: hypothetical protein ACTSRC_08450 [Candidatus Helarchaeota archaeon]
MSNIMIDTQIWIFSKKVPTKVKYDSDSDFQDAFKLHKKATQFFQNLPNDTIIYLSIQQIGELFHTLSFRGFKMALAQTKEFINDLINSKHIKIVPYSLKDFKRAIELSVRSRIHIWDYLCVIPLIEHISKVYTTDAHFKNETFSELGLSIENPLDTWQNL